MVKSPVLMLLRWVGTSVEGSAVLLLELKNEKRFLSVRAGGADQSTADGTRFVSNENL